MPRLQPLAWMLGSWQRTGLPEGDCGYERWHPDGSGFAGVGARLKDGRLVFEERLRLEADSDGVFYVADVAENTHPVRFRLVAQAGHRAIFENPEHDFPKRIAYRLDGDVLEVSTSGNGREVVFRFRRSSAATLDRGD
ncbi:MAG TPA: hypothetical protein DDZ67_09960 [Xanthomonadaceae bacterium]|nr:hypothetical protein [Xanthomonadaceae bacterium]